MNRPKKASNRLTFKSFLLKLITILIPVIILLAAEGVLKLTKYGDDFSLIVQNPNQGYEKYMMLNPDVGKKYFQKLEYTKPSYDIFLKEKPENTFRIFVMGSSTVAGFPYEQNLMFSRILNQQIEEAFPLKKIEVVNTAITAINSFTLLDFTDQILEYEPDAILIYAGHNEFYGALGIGSNEAIGRNRNLTLLHITLMDFKIYQLIRNIITGVSQKILLRNSVDVEGTLMKRMVAGTGISYNSKEYNIAIDSYRKNMDDILEKITEKSVPVFLSELVCNVKDMEPFSSDPDGVLEPAVEVYRKAQIAEVNKEYELAKELYYKAKDLDEVRFRASEDINIIIKNLSEKYSAHLVPMLAVFQENSPNGLIGNNLMTEHLHPNIDGYFIMADAFFTEILESGIVGEPLLSQRITREYIQKNYGYTILDSLTAHHSIQLLKGNWPFVKVGEEINYMKEYKPKSYLDSLTLEILKDENLSLGTIRYQLAQQYDKNEMYFEAFKEYNAFLRTNPYIGQIYRDAGTALINLNDLPMALSYFQKSLEFEESGFAYFKIAEIHFYMGDYNTSVSYFQKAFPLIPEERKIQALAITYAAYIYSNNLSAAQQVANELKRLNAENYLDIPEKSYIYNDFIPFQTNDEVMNAKKLLSENNDDEALQLLESSLNTYDSHIASRLIGEIYLRQRNIEMALFYFEKVYSQFRFDPNFLYDLALIYYTKNDVANANKCLQEIIKTEPAYTYLEQLKNILSTPN